MLLALLLLGAGSFADLDDPHLNVIPRTPVEAARIETVTKPASTFTAAEAFEKNPGGAGTSLKRANRDAFSQSSANLGYDEELAFKVGNGLFRKLWVSAPSSTVASDGLGPLYNARSCQRCHLKDGRGHPPDAPTDSAVSMFLRVSIPAPSDPLQQHIEAYLATAPDPVYGTQLQDFALPGSPAEYRLDIHYDELEVMLSGGETVALRRPSYEAADLKYGPLHPDAMLSPRIAPPMIGLGLLEAIPTADILANTDPEDLNHDGISGRANIVWSTEYQRPILGRFGLKAGMPTLRAQNAAAFSGDIGISTPLHPDGWGECTKAQAGCRSMPDGGDSIHDGFEASDEALDLVTFYSRNLAVPARRGVDDPQVLQGKKLFYETGCVACHVPKFVTHRLVDRDEQSFQLIWPYSDLLLHDMGAGLADNRPEARATGREWRTTPLWGLGLTEKVNGHSYLLHDGRARSVLEAILWHGGEASASQQEVINMTPESRAALLRFLASM